MRTIRQWLESLDLGQYGDAFEENAINWALVPDLTEALLERLGITALGHRMRILKAIEAFKDEQALSSSKGPIQAPSESVSIGEAEHRQLTVMFCDLVGSVELGERMDVEDYRDLLGRFRRAAVDAIEAYGGFIARHQGDGLLVYFGYPRAHEDDAESSVRAGLQVVRAVAGLEQPYEATPCVRVGIATGPAIVGDVLATGASQHAELAALGPTPNLAARLQGEAAPNSVVISETTQRLVEGVFVSETLGGLSLKGFRTPTTAFRVDRETGRRSRLAMQGGRPRTHLVGRSVELALLLDRWRKACESSGQVVLVAAEPGVGKSRLGMELVSQLRSQSAARVTLYCSPYHADAPLHPVVEAIRRFLGLGIGSSPEEQLERLASWLQELGLDVPTHVPLLGPLLGVPPSSQYPASEIADEERRNRTLRALVNILFSLSQQRPVLLFVEDLHWVDPTTQEFLAQISDMLRGHRILALFTFRPEYHSPWRPAAHLTLLSLNHLTGNECRTLIESITGSTPFHQRILEAIAVRSDGVPLYLEELSRSVLEQGGDDETLIPETLRDALTARLDRLGASRETLQLASVLGRQFETDVLRVVRHEEPGVLNASLEALVAADLVHGRGEGRYEFKHALIRDIAYESMLKAKRQTLHEAVADALVGLHSEALADVCESVAYHYGASTRAADAAKFLVMSATKAVSQYAHREAIELLGRALVHADASTTLLDASCTPARILLRTAQSLYFVGEFGTGTELLTQEASRLDLDLESDVAAEWYFWLSHMVLRFGRHQEAIDAARRSIELAGRIDDWSTMGKAHGVLVMASEQTGDLESGEKEGATSLALLERAGEPYWLGMTHGYLGWVRMNAGRFRDSLNSAKEAERIADEIGDDRLRTYALFFQSWTYGMAGAHDQAVKYGMAALDAAPDRSSSVHASHVYGCACLHAGRFEDAARLLVASAEHYQQFHYPNGELRAQAYAAEALLELGDAQRASEWIERAEQTTQRIHYPYGSGLTKRVRAKLVAGQGQLEQAIRILEQALADFRNAGANASAQRTHRTLSELHGRKGDESARVEHERLASGIDVQLL